MYKVLIQYFENRFASFFVSEPIQNYKDLVDYVRKVIGAFRYVEDDQLKILYKDIELDTFINIDPSEKCCSLHLSEAFRNSSPTGSDCT
jgi:hypothetical protein